MRLWIDLHQHRSAGMGLMPFSWQDFHAYCAVTGEHMTREDVRIVGLIEDEFFASRAEAEERKTKAAERKGAITLKANPGGPVRPHKAPALRR